jgi:hypothetical protein
MSVPAANFTAISSILEKDILDIIPFERYQRAPLLKMFGGYEPVNDQQSFYRENRTIPVGTRGTDMKNNTLYFPMIVGSTGGAGAMSNALQVTYGNVPMQQGNVPLTNQYTAFIIPENVLLAPGVVKDTFALYVQQATNSSAMDRSRQLYSDGTAQIGTANATQVAPSATFVYAASTNGDIDYAEFTPANTIIQIGSNQPVLISDVTDVNTVTLATAQSWTAADAVYKVDSTGVHSGIEYVGLNGIIGTGAYAGVTNPAWKSQTSTSFGSFSGSGGEATMNTLWVKTTRNGNPSTIFMNGTLFTTYGNGLTTLKQFQSSYEAELYGGWGSLAFMGGAGTVALDFFCPDDHIYFLSPESMWMATLEPMHWLPGTQGVLNRIPGSANFEAVATEYDAAFCNVRSANSFMSGVTP